MSQSYVIDGYNLIHSMTTLSKRAGPGVLEKSRLRLLGLLQHSFGEQSSHVTVVFDARGAPVGSIPEQEFHGMKVRFAIKGREADDVIEDLIRHDAAPKQLTVVSNDHRLQQAARRKKANVMSCEDFLDLLERLRRPKPTAPASPEKKEGETPEETKRLLDEFGDLDEDLGDINYGF